MKKLLVLMLVLGMVSVANAGLISVVVDRIEKDPMNQGPIDVVEPSDIVYIKITSQVALDAYDFDLHVTGPGTLMEVDGGPGLLEMPYTPNRQDNNFNMNNWWIYSGIVDNSIA